MKKNSLKDLINSIDWMMIIPQRGAKALKPHELSIAFCASKKDQPEKVDEVRIRLGCEVAEKLDWEPGDRIAIYQDPDDLFHFMLVKTEAGTGFKLSKENNSHAHRLNFRWNKEISLDAMPSKLVEYETYKGYLSFYARDLIEE